MRVTVPILRNCARLLRNEGGIMDSERIVLTLCASALAVGGLALALALGAGLGLSFAASALAFGLQFPALAYRPTAIGVAVIGTLVACPAAAVLAAFVVGAVLPPKLEWLGWGLGTFVGLGIGWRVGRHFRRAIVALKAQPDWY
jgi:hypothetical protein